MLGMMGWVHYEDRKLRHPFEVGRSCKGVLLKRKRKKNEREIYSLCVLYKMCRLVQGELLAFRLK